MKRTQSEDREAQNGQWAISSSTDYLNKRSKDFMVRNNPLGLAEPSVKRDGYAVGSREGSMYRSTGNLNVSSGVAGSRAGSESKDLPKGNWKERRASTSDLKGSGIRVGGNLVEPSAKPCMPFGSGAGGGNVVRRRQVNKSSQQQKTTRSSSTSRTSTTSTMQQVSTALEQIQVQESRSQVTVALPRGRSRAQSLPRGQVTNEESSFRVSLPASARTSRQASVEPEAQRKLTRHGSVEIYDGSYNLTVPNKQSRSASKTRLEQTKGDHIRIEAGDEENGNGTEEASSPSPAPLPSVQQTYAGPTTVEQTYELPAPAVQQQQQQQIVQQSTAVEQTSTSSSLQQTSIQQSSTTVQEVQQTSVEQSSSVQHNSTQESFAVQQNAVQQSSTMHSSSSKQESSLCSVEQSIQQSSSQQSSVLQSSVQQTSNQQSSSTQSVTQQQFVTQCAIQQQSSVQQTSVQQSSQQSIQQQSSQQQSIQQSGKQRSRNTSGTQDRDTVVQSGGKFNITQGLSRRSRHQSGSCEQRQAAVTQGPGAALRGLDTALEKIAAQQRKQEDTNGGSTTYVAKVSSRQTSRRQSVSATNGEEVTTVTLSLPPSQRGSRQTSRRGSVSEGGGARKSRRGSLDIYTAEYALKIGGGEKKGITQMEQKTAFHMKVENESESEMELCGRCHLPTHKTKACPEFGTLSCPRCLEWGHWEDACWTQDGEAHVCSRCDYEGHNEVVHDAEDFKQRRAVVDTLGWEPFQNWFYDQTFRGWWQVTGCVGVPLYRIYPRKTAWRTEKPEVTEDEPVAKSSLTRADSVDDMIAQVKLLSQRRPVVKKDSEEDSSGRSTPAHLR